MDLSKKSFRYIYWIFMAFVKKNAQLIVLSFLISLLTVIAFLSFSPYILKALTTQKQTIGITGAYTTETLPDEILSKFSNGLLYIDDKGNLIPLLVDSWEPVNGGKEYRFHIKKDLPWNDGKPFVAQDIKYSFKDIQVEAQNDYLLVFKLTKPLPIFPNFLTRPILKYPLIGVAGAYKVEKIKLKAGNITELQLNPQQEGQPIIVYKFYDTDTKLIQAYKLGEITEMSTTKANVAEMFQNWKNTTIDKQVDYSKVVALFFNLNDPLLKEEKDLRHAIAESINKEIYAGSGQEAYGPIQPTSWAYEAQTRHYQYNPNVSQKIIDKYIEATDSAQIKISTYYDHLALADEIKDNLEQVGIKSQVEVLTGNLPPDYNLLLAQMTLSKDPDQYFFWHSTQPQSNITNYRNVRVDLLLERGRGTFNLSDRKEIYSDFQKTLVEDMPAYFLYYPNVYTIKRK